MSNSLSNPKVRVLLADEDDATRALLEDNLNADGYHLDAAADRDEALACLRRSAPDLIVADVNGSTLALLDWLRGADPAYARRPPTRQSSS